MTNLQPWDEISRRVLTHFKVFKVWEAVRRSPRTGRESGMFLLDTLDWANVVALTDADELLLVNQYRHGSGAFSLEIPGGVIDPGEEPMAAIVRELREETGHQAESVQEVAAINPNPALFTNRCHTFLATGCREVGPVQQDDGEDLEVIKLPRWELRERVLGGEVYNAVVLSALYLCDQYLGREGRPPIS